MRAGPSLKRAVKRAVKSGVAVAGRFRTPPAECARILTYHSVGRRDHDMNVTPDAFEAQMTWLAAHHRVIPLADAAQGRPGVAITFDDGYRDVLLNAAPVLHRLGIPATVFVVPGRSAQMLDHDNDPETSRLLDWDDLPRLEALGMSIGAHTMTHRRLATLSSDEQRHEIVNCAQCLRERLGHPIEAFAYPFGAASDYNQASVCLVQEAGFAFALSNRYGVNRPGADSWTLRRIWIDNTDSLRSFQHKVDGRLDALALLDSDTGLRLRRALNRLLGLR